MDHHGPSVFGPFDFQGIEPFSETAERFGFKSTKCVIQRHYSYTASLPTPVPEPESLHACVRVFQRATHVSPPPKVPVYTPHGGCIRNTNGQNLPILGTLQMNAERGVLYGVMLIVPDHLFFFLMGQRSIIRDNGQSVFDGDVRQGQLVIVPQMFVVLKQAGNEGFEYIAFKTNDNAISNPLVDKASAFRAMPEDVLMNAYRISREETRRLKYNRGEETKVFEPSYQRSEGVRASA
ncbi:13S globulin basic chain-like [Magnolia sinica]|uniref:13S globulin basic chain-like n=1 Tax=Magnolia sinica TaxID=86752 RepID=UPI00265B4147|nr:13S globulin basic chain-like [Magnolia sinica]